MMMVGESSKTTERRGQKRKQHGNYVNSCNPMSEVSKRKWKSWKNNFWSQRLCSYCKHLSRKNKTFKRSMGHTSSPGHAVIAAFKSTTSFCHWPAIFVLQQRSGDVGHKEAHMVAAMTGSSLYFSLKPVDSAPQFPVVAWIMREIIDSLLSGLIFSQFHIEFSIFIKRKRVRIKQFP